MTLSLGWYAQNRSRSYPLEGYATAKDDSGQLLPESLIADLKLRFPGDENSRAFVRYAAAGKTLSVVIANESGDLASATIKREAVRDWKPVPLVSTIPGVYGYVVFGATSEFGVWTFSSVNQSGLSVRAAAPQPYFNSPARLSRQGFEPMQGPVTRLIGDGDVRVERAKRTLLGQERDAVVVSLATQQERDVLAEYAGPCGRRPESKTCGDPLPIEDINGVKPDCCGRVFIEFRGCVDMLPLANACGVLVQCEVTADEACPPSRKLPNEIGELPGKEEEEEEDDEEPDDCEDESTPKTNQSFTSTTASPTTTGTTTSATTTAPTTTSGTTTSTTSTTTSTTSAPTTSATSSTTVAPTTTAQVLCGYRYDFLRFNDYADFASDTIPPGWQIFAKTDDSAIPFGIVFYSCQTTAGGLPNDWDEKSTGGVCCAFVPNLAGFNFGNGPGSLPPLMPSGLVENPERNLTCEDCP